MKPSKHPAPAAPSLRTRFLGSFSNVPQAMALVWKSSPGGTMVIAVVTILAALLPLGIAWVGKLIVDSVVAARMAEAGPARDLAVGQAIRWVVLELGLVSASSLLERLGGLVRQLAGARLGMDISLSVLEKALKLDLRHFEDSQTHDKLLRARREASFRPLSLVQQSLTVVRGALTLVGYAGLLIAFSPWAALGLCLAAVPSFLVEARFSNAGYRMKNLRSPDARKLNYLEYLLTSDDHVKEVKLFELGPVILARYRELAKTLQAEDRRLALQRAIWTFFFSFLSTLAFYGCYVAIVFATVVGRLSFGDMTLYLVVFRQGQQTFQSILSALGGMYEDNLYLTNLFEFYAIPVDTASGPGARAVSSSPAKGIRFENVGFRYPGAADWALREITLSVPQGASLALVGENGAGKTTFIKLLTRLYEPTEGRILLDGIDLREWAESDLRRRIGVIFQDFSQYQFLLRENVGFGSVEHLDDDLRLNRAIDRGGAREFVSTLSAGLDTQLGRWFAEGTELSGGQWQKIALARAFMREEADILVLDEPTAALDALAEHAVFERFRALTAGRTAILISHRFPTVRMADRIVVIDRGRVMEQGSHQELLAQNGRYAQLFALQAEGYR
jgi:ATP-binding cassette subfamily B protein